MASPAQKRGLCGYLMGAFNKHAHYARGCEKGKSMDPCIMKTEDFPHCNILTEEQELRLATPSYCDKETKRYIK